MTPLPETPKVSLLLNDNDEVVGLASNLAPAAEMEVNVTRSHRLFDEISAGLPFRTGSDTLPNNP